MKVKVVNYSLETSKKSGKQYLRITSIGDDGVVVFFAPLEDDPKPGDVYDVGLRYSPYDFNYKPSYKKA